MKKITVAQLKHEQTEIYIGSILTDVITFFMMVAVAATLFVNKIVISEASEAALAVIPFAGHLASILFGIGLLIAGFLGCAIVPLATAYAYAEFFGYEGSLDTDFKKSRSFYIFFIVQIILGMLVVMLPQISLFKITLYADFLNGIFLPLIFYFLYIIANDEEIMGKYRNSRLQNALLIGCGIIITIGATAGGLGHLLHL